ncbi:YbdD/YjiX family protein [Tersicoccus sp. MR15.9]|uniref:YbdD/YjiX family protein n=1 Tax=Tersicoccus mangrovi TaxID=3121635 RepID=UPI002FE56858
MSSTPFPGPSATGGRSCGSARRPSGWWATVRWYVRGVMGEDAYETYVAHRQATHPGEPVMSERDYWRARNDWQDKNPQGRCC